MADENVPTGSDNPGNPGENTPGDKGTPTFSPDQWREMISKDYAEDATLADFKSLDDVMKSYINAQKLIGSDKRVKIPEEGDKENWMSFYDRIGRPKEASGYEFGIPEGAPEGYESEQFQAYAQEFRKTVHDLGLTKSQAENLWNYQQKASIDAYQNQSTAFKQQLEALEETAKKEFGQKLPEVVKLRNNIIAQYGDESVASFIKDNPIIERSPAILKMFEKIGKALGEDKITREVKDRALTPREAKSKLMSMTTDRNNPLYEAYQKQQHPRHDEAVKEFNKLIGFLEED